MPLVSDTIPNLVNGVSQQASTIRLPSQAESQTNALSSIVDGLQKRPPTEHVAKLTASTYGNALVHTINRDSSERYQVIIVNGDLFVYDIDGTSKTVSFPDGKSYLTTSTPATSIKALTVQDFTFIVNTEDTAEMDSATTSDTNGSAGLVFVKQSQVNNAYKIYIDGTQEAAYTPGSTVSPETIANDLASDMASLSGYTVTREDSTIKIVKDDGTDFELGISGGNDGIYMTMVKEKVQRLTDLPTVAFNDFIVKVTGTDGTAFDDYYVKFETDDSNASSGPGIWAETVGPGIEYQLDAATMPHILVRESSGNFTFKEATWGDRTVGDTNSNPDPSFVDSSIQDIFLHKNRLGVTSRDNVIFSESGEFFNFFRTAMTTLLDSDPIDLNVAHTKASNLYHAVPYSEKLILFSDQTQFELSNDDILAPDSVVITPTTEFGCSTSCKPVGAGSNIYFVNPKDENSGVMEYFVSDEVDTKDASNITAHIPKYIPANVIKLASSPTEDIIIALSSDETSTLYVYKYYWDKEKKLQSSWSKWVLDDGCEILNVDFINDTLYLCTQYSDGIFLESMVVSPKDADPNQSHRTLLDRRLTEADCTSVTYDSGTDKTTFTIPHATGGTYQIVARYQSPQTTAIGTIIPITSSTSTTLVVNGDYSGTNVYIGRQYTMEYQFSPFYRRQPSQQGGMQTVTKGRTQIRTLALDYNGSGYFTIEVTPKYRDTSTHKFTGRILGSGNNVIGQLSLETGTFRVPIMTRNTFATIILKNDSPVPSNITSATWEGYYHSRSK